MMRRGRKEQHNGCDDDYRFSTTLFPYASAQLASRLNQLTQRFIWIIHYSKEDDNAPFTHATDCFAQPQSHDLAYCGGAYNPFKPSIFEYVYEIQINYMIWRAVKSLLQALPLMSK